MTWRVTEDSRGDQTLWHGDTAVLRKWIDVETPDQYQDLLWAVLTRVLAPDEATIERLCEALGSAHLEFYGDLEIPHWGRHLANAALAALAGTRDTGTEAGGG